MLSSWHHGGQEGRWEYAGQLLHTRWARYFNATHMVGTRWMFFWHAGVHASQNCPQISFKNAQNFVRVSCGYLHAGVIAKHNQGPKKATRVGCVVSVQLLLEMAAHPDFGFDPNPIHRSYQRHSSREAFEVPVVLGCLSAPSPRSSSEIFEVLAVSWTGVHPRFWGAR